ncbi:hypothetical protein ACA910_015422 [Epithemia clementina (nom. ined.)]
MQQESFEMERLSKNEVKIRQQVEELTATDADLTEESRFDLKESNHSHKSSTVSTTVKSNNGDSAVPFVTDFVPLRMGGSGRSHMVSEGSTRLIEDEVTLDDLERMTTLFYDKAFEDVTLDKFIRSHNDPHAARFAKWIHQKLSGSTVWDQERRERSQVPVRLAGGHRHLVHDRSSAHVAAWHSPKRPAEEVGRHFKLDECRVWMRLHFWALRESGLLETAPNFCDYYIRFIGHFVRVYESTAPLFARESFRWSADPRNIERYLENGRRMNDVLDLSLHQSKAQLPVTEARDSEWPYIDTLRRG